MFTHLIINFLIPQIGRDPHPLRKQGLRHLLRIVIGIRGNGCNDNVPVLFVDGRKEAEDETVSIRRLGAKQQQVVNFQTAIAALLNEIKEKQSYSGDTERTQTAE